MDVERRELTILLYSRCAGSRAPDVDHTGPSIPALRRSLARKPVKKYENTFNLHFLVVKFRGSTP